MTPYQDDTICAVATPTGEGGIGVIRVSGTAALSIVSGLVKPRKGGSVDSLANYVLTLSDVFSAPPSNHPNSLTPLDEALVVVMRGPHSFTGEDIVEIQTHGGPYILEETCRALVSAGARIAEPGEFTKRAFLNGRLDLTQAEAVLDTIRATTSASLKVAQNQLRGLLSKEVERIIAKLVRLLAHIEAEMDFAEEDISFVPRDEVESILTQARTEIKRLEASFQDGRVIREGVRVAIIGRPNVGKSSLLNALLRTDRAIVSPIPGTTRDVIDDVVTIGGVAMRLIDTAGLRATTDVVEEEGIRRTREAISDAAFILIVVDGSVPLQDEDRTLLREFCGYPHFLVFNKTDCPVCVTMAEVLECLDTQDAPGDGEGLSHENMVQVSALTGKGLDELRDRMRQSLFRSHFEPGEAVFATRTRHRNALVRAHESIDQALESVINQASGEVVALDMRSAIDCLGEITGRITHDDILDQIFREFCIGK